MAKPTLVLLSRRGRESIHGDSWTKLQRYAHVRAVVCNRPPSPTEAVELLTGADLLGSTNACLPTIDAALLDDLPRLRGIVLYATGYDHLDVDLLTARGVGLSVLRTYATTAVAEHAMAMLLSLAARVHLANDRSRGLCPPDVSLRGVELAGRTLGVIGLGRIGRRVAKLGRAFGMTVVGTDPDPVAVLRARAAGIRTGRLEWLLGNSHAVAVCASHSIGAPPIIGFAEMELARPDAVVVNVARAAVVDTAAATAAIRAGRLRGYAVDDTVIDPSADGDLLEQGRILQTGHSAWWRDEVLERGARMWGERLLAAVRDRPLDVVTWPTGDTRRNPMPIGGTSA
jgi:phosphoglycerate dehydrogenase-like enzyme